ncbi:MAG: DUF4199 domain-containing protein [Emticicia sp.]|nr:DUF4199 domain-containing protein [Emticicia sp.]
MEKASTARIALKWGIITAIVSIIYTIVYYKTRLFQIPILSWMTFIFLLFGLIICIKEFKTTENSIISFSESLSLGTLMSAITGLVYQIFSNVYNTYIDPSVVEKMELIYKNQLQAQGLSPEKVVSEIEDAAKYTTPGLVFIEGIILHIIFGFVFSLIVSAIVKNSKPEMEF